MKPAVAGEAPSSSAVRAMMGAIAPLPISYTMAGRNTDGIIERSDGSRTDGLAGIMTDARPRSAAAVGFTSDRVRRAFHPAQS